MNPILERLKLVRDCIEINIPNGLTMATIRLAEIRDISAIGLSIVSIVCTIILTRSKINRRDKE